MGQNDDEIREYVKFKASRLLSTAAYHKLKAAILSHEREEQAKSKVLSGALLGLVVLFVGSVLVWFWVRRYAGLLVIGCFFIWAGYVLILMRHHLGKRTVEGPES